MKSATSILALLVVAGILVLVDAVGVGFSAQVRLLVAGMALMAIAAAGVAFLLTVRRPIRVLAGSMRARLSAVADAGSYSRPPSASDLDDLAHRIGMLVAHTRALETALAAAEADRARALGAQREAEERYALVVERANDGVWECALESGVTHFSARWQSMLGCPEQAPETLEQWYERLHPDDRDSVRMALQSYLTGTTPAFEAEYRIQCGSGVSRWLYSRGTALRHASGTPYRLLVQDNDIQEKKTLEMTLIEAAEGMSMLSGQALFRSLAQTLAGVLGTRDNLVCVCEGEPPVRARALAYYSRGKFWEEPLEYELAGTSCGDVIARGEIVYCPTGVGDLWPVERKYDRDSYLGVPMFDSGGKVIGHFACMDGGPMRQDMPHLALFKLFAIRAAAELERSQLEARLAGNRSA